MVPPHSASPDCGCLEAPRRLRVSGQNRRWRRPGAPHDAPFSAIALSFQQGHTAAAAAAAEMEALILQIGSCEGQMRPLCQGDVAEGTQVLPCALSRAHDL